MSNFTGVTFQEQNVRPSDDAIIRRMILSDGILYGCALSYSGSTLTMAAGQLLACGRQFEHPASQNWAVVDATSGYARLVLTIDLTKTATEETFEQVVDTIEYASSLDGFPHLDQTDVNVSGLRYQIVACVVSLGTGGITGIVEQLGPCEVTGGGANFKVVGGLTQPANPTENTIWVETEYEITSWIFDFTEPSAPAEGMVWITVGTSSTVAFNILKKNTVQVYPISAKQYVGGAWVDVTAMSYQDGAWAEWYDYIIQSGKPAEWEFGAQLRSNVLVEVTQNTDFITVVSNKDGQGGTATNTKVDLSNYSYIIADIDVISVVTGGSSTADQGVCLAVTNGINAGSLTDYRGSIVSTAMTVAVGRQSLMLPVSELNGEYYVGFLFGADTKNTSTINIYSLGLAR